MPAPPVIQILLFDPQFRENFKNLNLEWIQKYFVVEKKDVEQLENPETCLAEGGEIFFALKNKEVVGTTGLYMRGPGVYELAKMAVSPKAQGHGIADLLMKTCEDWAREKKASKIYLLSNDVLKPAMHLYKKHGYVVFLKGAHPEYDRCNIGMEKILN